MDGRSNLRNAALVCGAALAWSSGGLLVRLIENVDGWTIAFWRSAFMVLGIGGLLFVTRGADAFAAYRAVGWTGVLSGLLFGGAFVMFILAVTHTSVANAVVLQSAAPLVTALLARLFLHEALTARTMLAVLAAIGGVALMFAGAIGAGDLLGNALALGVAVAFGANIVVVRSGRALDLVPATVLAGLFAMVATLPMASLASPSPRGFVVLATMGTLQLGLGLFLFMRGAPGLRAAQVGLLSLLEVILGPVWVWLALGELPSPLALAGGAVVLAAVAAHTASNLLQSPPTALASTRP
jgi:drug/metabolite transporter (DMT)-like permease